MNQLEHALETPPRPDLILVYCDWILLHVEQPEIRAQDQVDSERSPSPDQSPVHQPGPLRTFRRVLRAGSRPGQTRPPKPQHHRPLSVAKLRLGDFEKTQRQAAENQTDAKQGKMLFAEALKILRSRIEGDASLEPRSRGYYEQRLVALLKSWPVLEQKDVRTITKSDCLNWAAKFARETCATAFNNTVSVLRRALDIAVEPGVRYDNPATATKRVSVRPKPAESAANRAAQRA